jgi:ADP-L-glycero-D-manno-heptose 6-epimerase
MTDLSSRRLVVTGGAGFIGSALVWALNRRGIDDILIVDRLDETEKWKHLVPLRFADYVDADDFLARALDGDDFGDVGTIVHLGACSSTTETDSDYLMRNNFEYTKQLALWAVDNAARFVYASSAATYGARETDLSDRLDLRDLRPLNMYAYSKHLFDLYAARTGLDSAICGIKYFNVFGPNEDHKGNMRSLVHKAFEQIRDGGTVSLFKSYRPEFADGEQRRDFVYVKDAVDMTLFLTESDASGLYNVGSGRAQTWLELVRPIFAALGRDEKIEFVEMPDQLRPKYQYSTCARMESLREAGYAKTPASLSDAVTDYVRHYLIPGKSLDPADKSAS